MGFHNIVLKMAKANFKKYLFYFLCNTVVVMIFFMFSTIFFNEDIIKVKKEESLDSVLAVPAVALVVFTVIFIQYAHNIFIKKRKHEFALFMSLGMTKRDIAKLLQLENFIIIFSSLIVGLLFGMTFSRLFFLLLIKSIEFDKVHFHVNAIMFLVTIGLFLIIQLIVVGKSFYLLLYGNLLKNLKSERLSQNLKLESVSFGLFGLCMLIFSIICLYVNYNYNARANFLYLWAILTFFGLYICLSQFMNMFIKFVKKHEHLYYSKIMFFTNLHHKFHKLFSIIMLISVMFMITIWYSTIVLFTYKIVEKEFLENNPQDLVYIQSDTKNNLPFYDVKEILETEENKIKQHITVPFHVTYDFNEEFNWYYANFYFMPVDAFNNLTSKQITLEQNEFLYFVNNDPNYLGDDFIEHEELALPTTDNKKIIIKRKDTFIEHKINYVGEIYDCIVVNNEQFEFLKDNIDGFSGNIHIINMEYWKKSKKEIEQLTNTLLTNNKTTPPIDNLFISTFPEEQYFEVESKLISLKRIKSSYGLQLFVITFLSILCFIGAFILLYLNLFSEIDKEKKVYSKLFKIGITKKELIQMIGSEMKMIFFLPTFIGAILALLYFVAMLKEVGGITKNLDALLYFFIVCCIYFIIQIIFYFYSKGKMVRALTE